MAGSLSDITARTALDPLTELPNRLLFQDRLDRALGRLRRRDIDHLAVLAIGIDRLAVVDESLGPETVDELLVACAKRLEKCLRPGDTLARDVGDTFLALLEDVRSPENTERVAERILADLRQPFAVAADHAILLTANLGLAVSATGEEEAAHLLHDADAALRQAQSRGRGTYQLFDREMRQNALQRLRLEADLLHALERHELVLRYQPIVRLRDGEVFLFEALLRWHHPERGLIAPGEFLPVAVDCGALDAISAWTLDESCRQLAAWAAADPPFGLPISLNLTAAQLSDPALAGKIREALARHGVPASHLCIEITETALARDPRVARAVIVELRELGVRIAIDDFGVGYSSLSHLHQFPVDVLKIDRTFVSDLTRKGQPAELIRSIVDLGRRLGLSVVAEGVETATQRRRLLAIGCPDAQGFFYAPALPADEARAYALTITGRRRGKRAAAD